MAQTKIEWTDYSWNPVTGCTPVSPGCANCFAKRMANRLRGRFGYPDNDPFRVTLHTERLEEPLRWKKPRRVFVCSMGDLFHSKVPDDIILDIFAVMASCPHLIFLILTKRPGRMYTILTDPTIANDVWVRTIIGVSASRSAWPLPNVWLGVTAENQKAADERIPILLQIPATVRFVSVEPMLGPVDLEKQLGSASESRRWLNGWHGIDWVIAGGETGPNARPMHPDWVRSLRDQCRAARTSFWFKSWGEWLPEEYMGGLWPERANGICIKREWWKRHTWSDGVISFRVGKKKAGRLLDGRAWDEIPEVPA